MMNVKGLVGSVGCNVALVEYRGYGRSDGSPSEEGMYMDAQVNNFFASKIRFLFYSTSSVFPTSQ